MNIIHPARQYMWLIDPLLKKVHNLTSQTVPQGVKMIDIACGNGTLVLKASAQAEQITGIDLSVKNIVFAKRRAVKRNILNATFVEMDATDLSRFGQKEYDIATISMAIHQFPLETGMDILKEVSRIAGQIIVTDYNHPLPSGYKGWITRSIERMAGREHHQNFTEYMHFGGIEAIAAACGLQCRAILSGSGTVFTVVQLSEPE